MISIFLQAILLASSGFLAVGSLTLVTVMLMTDEGLPRALGYVLGYVLSYVVMGILIIMIGSQVAESTLSRVRVVFSILFIFLGLFLLYLAHYNITHPRTEGTEENKFFKFVGTLTPGKALGLGIAVTIINAKNLSLFLSAVSVVVLSQLSFFSKMVIVVIVSMVFSGSVTFPIIVYITFPRQRDAILRRIHLFLKERGRIISILVPIMFGLILVIKGVVDLS